MAPPPLLSVLIPTYNRADYLGEAIESVLEYVLDDCEIVISDNASVDGTADVARQYASKDRRIKVSINSENLGPIRNWRRCCELATGQYLHWLWSDDCVSGPFYRRWEECCDPRKKMSTYMSAARVFDANGTLRIMYSNNPGVVRADALWGRLLVEKSLPYSPASYILPTTPARAALGFDVPQFGRWGCMTRAIGPDLLMIIASVRAAGMLRCCGEPLVGFREHGGSISSRETASIFGHYRFAVLCYLRSNRVKLGAYVAAYAAASCLKKREWTLALAFARAIL